MHRRLPEINPGAYADIDTLLHAKLRHFDQRHHTPQGLHQRCRAPHFRTPLPIVHLFKVPNVQRNA